MELMGQYSLTRMLRQRLSLLEDKADDETIDRELRAGVEMRGTNLWVLMFAIFIASIGLNVNSTAVIIGAMLISPLMGPIMGIGYGIGIFDLALVRRAVKNLGIAVLIALLTSTVYFLFSPLNVVQSEILARTTPTLWDVLIALFGGLAGIIAVTRREKSNVIPGVAIATALMPPLCTAGFGVATRNGAYFLGAFYLFTINSVFIAFAAAVVTRAFHLRTSGQLVAQGGKKVLAYVGAIVVLTMLPSLFLAYRLVEEEVFKSKATAFVAQEFDFPQSHVINSLVDAKTKRIEVTLIGDFVPPEQIATVEARLPRAGLTGASLLIHQSGQRSPDLGALKSGLLNDLVAQSQGSLEKKDQLIHELQSALAAQSEQQQELRGIPAELQSLIPGLEKVWLSRALAWDQRDGIDPNAIPAATLVVKGPISADTKNMVERWLKARLKTTQVKLVIEPDAPAQPPAGSSAAASPGGKLIARPKLRQRAQR